MQWKVSSSLAAITPLFLLSAVDLVVAQIIAPICTDIGSSWQWVRLYSLFCMWTGLRSIHSRTTLWTKIRVQSQRTCLRHVTMAVISFKTLVCSVHCLMSLPPAVFDFLPLGLDIGYAGPSVEEVLEADTCWCNTVIYSLMSACSECQGGESITYV